MTQPMRTHVAGARLDRVNTPKENPKTVELFLDDMNRIYQFKVWGNALTSMFVLVREDSEILDRLLSALWIS